MIVIPFVHIYSRKLNICTPPRPRKIRIFLNPGASVTLHQHPDIITITVCTPNGSILDYKRVQMKWQSLTQVWSTYSDYAKIRALV